MTDLPQQQPDEGPPQEQPPDEGPPQEQPPDEELDLDYHFGPPRWKVASILALVVLGLASIVFYFVHGEVLSSWQRGETDLLGGFAYDPPFAAVPGKLAASDLEQVHRRLLPAWGIAMGSLSGKRAPAAMKRLRARVKDPNLLALLDELNRLTTANPGEHSERIFYLLRAWNSYLDRNRKPWHVDGAIRLRPRPFLYLKVYRVVADLRVQVSDESIRARLLRRVDGTNVVELYLGSASRHQDGAMVVVDRIVEFSINEVWPLLAPPKSDAAPPPRQRFGPLVRQEARRVLPASALTLLSRLAPARARLADGMKSINAQARCGSRFRVLAIPFSGLSERARSMLRRVAQRDLDGPCPAITTAAAEEMIEASKELEAAANLEAAVGALAVWVARGVTVHEARHVADDRDENLETSAPDCAACPPEMDRRTTAELSAYLASFATRDAGYLNLMQACSAIERSSGGANHRAIVEAVKALGGACGQAGLPKDLYTRAAALERKYFERSDTITLPADFPRTLALETR